MLESPFINGKEEKMKKLLINQTINNKNKEIAEPVLDTSSYIYFHGFPAFAHDS